MKDVIYLELLENLGFYKDGQLTDVYHECYQLYNNYLLAYLNEIFFLETIEGAFNKLEYPLKPIKDEDKDDYQKMSLLKFFYIRSFLHIEKLSSKNIDFLKKRVLNKAFSFDKDAKKLIEDSYKKVVKHHVGFDEEIVSYGDFSSGKYFAPNCAIVLGFRYDPQYGDDEDNPQYLEQYCKRKVFADTYINIINKEAEKKNIPLKVLKFDEYSVQFSNNDFKSY